MLALLRRVTSGRIPRTYALLERRNGADQALTKVTTILLRHGFRALFGELRHATLVHVAGNKGPTSKSSSNNKTIVFQKLVPGIAVVVLAILKLLHKLLGIKCVGSVFVGVD
ncbi:hypothetical protein HG530_013622 [Fusarium avenaceum]|nr:hypothetical protein HG530_013622 [Fusarium avenaceum]